MRVDQFDFQLPDACIALRPLEKRDDARMLKVGAGGSLDDLRVSDLPDCLRPGDALVFNDTRVIPAQLDGVRERGGNQAALSATLHLRLDSQRWWAFIRNAKRVRQGDTLRFRSSDGQSELEAHVEEMRDGGEALLAFASVGEALDRDIERTGAMPIPPYIASRRAVDAGDESAYQTIYAQEPGAVAAPTAGLHFTEDLMARLKDREIGLHYLTLHVGAGTFLPVKADDTADHRMHAERGVIDAATADRLNAVREAGGRLICVGTTSMRLVESAANEAGTIAPFAGTTDIFITPGYRFRACDGLLTNFHLPRSTLFMLVSAFSGLETMRRAYAHAIGHNYRFYSYGDACLLEPAGR